jgi:carotenoid cleavage dioxygenase
VVETQVDDLAIELPRIDERLSGRKSRYFYAVEQPTDIEMRGIVKYDRLSGRLDRHSLPEGDQNSEPIFVPKSAGSDEDDGFVITCIYRAATDTTDVAVLDARNLSDAPLALIELPRRIPAGFHGAWLPEERSLQ